jgi:hypothetical protein
VNPRQSLPDIYSQTQQLRRKWRLTGQTSLWVPSPSSSPLLAFCTNSSLDEAARCVVTFLVSWDSSHRETFSLCTAIPDVTAFGKPWPSLSSYGAWTDQIVRHRVDHENCYFGIMTLSILELHYSHLPRLLALLATKRPNILLVSKRTMDYSVTGRNKDTARWI